METDSCIILGPQTACQPVAERKLGFLRMLGKTKERDARSHRTGHLRMAIHGFVFLNLQNRPMGAIRKCPPSPPTLQRRPNKRSYLMPLYC